MVQVEAVTATFHMLKLKEIAGHEEDLRVEPSLNFQSDWFPRFSPVKFIANSPCLSKP